MVKPVGFIYDAVVYDGDERKEGKMLRTSDRRLDDDTEKPLFTGQQVEEAIDDQLENLEEMGHEECTCVTAEEVLKRVKNSLNSGGRDE